MALFYVYVCFRILQTLYMWHNFTSPFYYHICYISVKQQKVHTSTNNVFIVILDMNIILFNAF